MIRPEQITDQIAARIALDTIKRAKQDWYVLIKNNAEDKEYNELRAALKHDCRLYCDIIDLYFNMGNGEENQGAYYNMQQELKRLEYDRQNHIIREVPDEIL